MSDVISKKILLETVERLPEQINVDKLVERITLLAKIEEGIKAGREGKLIPQSEIEKIVNRWFE